MDVPARLTSKGQITIPKPVREALGLSPGDAVLFRVEGEHAVLARTPELLALAGSVRVPPGRGDVAWEGVRRHARRARGAREGA